MSVKIYIAGSNGLVGSACINALKNKGYNNLIFRTSKELDLREEKLVDEFIRSENPDVIIDCAAKVGGILANDTYPYEFLMDNMLMQNNLIKAAHKYNINKFIFLGSSCIYPKHANQPLKEEYLLTGSLEPTNQWYAIAKISGLKLIEALRKQFNRDYVTLMPTNLYGPRDNFDLKTSHVLPAMIRRFTEAENEDVTLWGTGSPYREFLHVNDLADAIIFTLENKMNHSIYNIGPGKEISIKGLAELIQKLTKHKGKIIWDSTKPDGTPRKLMNVSRINSLGWQAKFKLEEGIIDTINWFKKNQNNFRKTKF